jgi:hypothetical protein
MRERWSAIQEPRRIPLSEDNLSGRTNIRPLATTNIRTSATVAMARVVGILRTAEVPEAHKTQS